MRIWTCFVIVTVFGCVCAFPTNDPTTETLVVVNEDATTVNSTEEDAGPSPLQLKSMHVNANITNRYAHTVISSRYANPANQAQEATFSVVLPDTAFISGFVMEIKDKSYKAYVEEKKEAKRIYQQAIASGLGAAHVELNARDSNRFTVTVNVEPHSKVVFNLSYEQLLVRKHGKYDMVINLHPGQLVKDLSVDVYINETRRLLNVETPALKSGNEILEKDTGKKNEYAEINMLPDSNETAVHVHFSPTIQQQKDMTKILQQDKDTNKGLAGQFVVEYDVERDPSGGQVLVSDDGYFVHFFAPNQLKAIPKHVVFVLDVSGSMHGRKIEQVKEAMKIILDQLSPADYFNLVEFSFGAKVWNLVNTTASPTFESHRTYGWWRQPEEKVEENQELPPAFPATPENIKQAKDLIGEMSAGGGTNIFDALSTAFNITNAGIRVTNAPRPIVIFLTDGDATDGETNPKAIMEMAANSNDDGENAALFTLAFGSDANKDFLKKLSLQNSGFMRHIYEAADASLQLQDFYKQISSPLLANVSFNYPATVESLTKSNFHTLFDGGELIVAGRVILNGKMNANEDLDSAKVQALTIDGPLDFPPQVIKLAPRPVVIGQLERLWAYMTIKQLLDTVDAKSANDVKDIPEKKRALDMAIKYSFVTPVTSLVVVKPNETKPIATEEAQPVDKELAGFAYGSSPLFAAPQPISSLVASGGSFPGPPGGYAYSSQNHQLSYDSMPSPSLGFAPGTKNRVQMYAMKTAERTEQRISSPTDIRFDAYSDVDYAIQTTSRPLTTTIRLFTTAIVKFNLELIRDLPWLSSLMLLDNTEILLDNKHYKIGNNETIIDEKPCTVTPELSGNCTLLSSCPMIYSKLTDLDTYRQHFCALESVTEKISYAGVCCIE